MHGLTYGVIRVDSEEKLSVLTVQDVGLVMPGGEGGGGCRATGWRTSTLQPFLRARLDGESEVKMELPMGQGGFLFRQAQETGAGVLYSLVSGLRLCPGGRVHWLMTHAIWSVLNVILMSAWCVNPIYTVNLQQCTAMKCFTATRKSQLASGTLRACSLSLVVLLQMLLLFVFFFVSIYFSSPAPPTPSLKSPVLPVLHSAIMCSVKPDGVPQLCRTDEVGELCVCAVATGMSYYGLSGMTKNTFEVGGR